MSPMDESSNWKHEECEEDETENLDAKNLEQDAVDIEEFDIVQHCLTLSVQYQPVLFTSPVEEQIDQIFDAATAGLTALFKQLDELGETSQHQESSTPITMVEARQRAAMAYTMQECEDELDILFEQLAGMSPEPFTPQAEDLIDVLAAVDKILESEPTAVQLPMLVQKQPQQEILALEQELVQQLAKRQEQILALEKKFTEEGLAYQLAVQKQKRELLALEQKWAQLAQRIDEPLNAEEHLTVPVLSRLLCRFTEDLQGIRSDMQGIRSDFQGVRSDFQGVRSDFQGLTQATHTRWQKDISRADRNRHEAVMGIV